MKRLLFILAVMPTLIANAQTQGKVTYSETRKMELNFEGHDNEQIKSMMPKSMESNNELLFTETASLYQPLQKEDSEDDLSELNMQEGGANIQIKMATPETIVYRDVNNEEMIESRDFMGKKFLITGEEPKKWKLTAEQSTVQNYTCVKAILQDTSNNVVAWFTPQIPISTGPGEFAGLPGMVLKVEEDEGRRVIEATEISFDPIDMSALKKPNSGKKVTREKFVELVKERMEEMNAQMGGGGFRVIRMEGH